MEKMELRFDCYDVFDRLGESVMFKLVVSYDWDDIIKNDVTGDNFQVEMIGFADDVDAYFKAYHISREKWTNEVQEFLMHNDCERVKEMFFEELPDEKYAEYEEKFFSE